MKIFHREEIFNHPEKAWSVYRNNPEYFRFPERITVELTNRCNLRCFMCPRNKVNMKLGDMDVDLFKKIVDEASQFLPVCLVPFFRGESLLHPQFIEMLTYAKNKGLSPIQLATNAYFLSEELSSKILDLEIDFISFSVDVNSPSVYEKIRKHSDFERVFSNVLGFIKERNKRKFSKPQIQISAVKIKENENFIKDFIDFWIDKVERVRIYFAHSLNGRLGYVEGEEEIPNIRKPCLKLLTDIVIYWNGDVAICNHDWDRDLFIGNVKQNSIQQIWHNSIYTQIRGKHLENKLEDFPPCNFCSHWKAYYKDNFILGEVYEKNKVSSD